MLYGWDGFNKNNTKVFSSKEQKITTKSSLDMVWSVGFWQKWQLEIKLVRENWSIYKTISKLSSFHKFFV